MSRRLLALTWMMPPLIFPRSLQISRTLQAMAERGWQTTAIAVPPAVEPLAAQDQRLAEFYADSYRLSFVEPREEVIRSPLWVRLFRWVMRLQNLTSLNWNVRATKALRRQILENRPDAFISFAQPWINHVVGLRIKRQFPDLPWITHFSDPWVDSPYFNPASKRERRNAIRHERAIISAADSVIFTTQETADLVMGKYPAHWASKVCVVSHGYDANLLDLVPTHPKSDRFTIAHTGNLYDKREPLAFIKALKMLRQEIGPLALQMMFIGHSTQAMRDMVAELELEDIVSISPNVPYFDSLAIARSADLVLVIDAPATHSVFLPSKIVDYLSLRRPILALTPVAGASARVLGGLGFPAIDPTDEAGILVALREALQRWRNGGGATPLPEVGALRQFDIRVVAADFERAVTDAISAKEKRHA